MGEGLVITNDYAISDMANLQHPLRHFVVQTLQQGQLPLWTPGVYMGYPLLAEGQAGVFYPFNLLLFGTLPPLLALNWSILLTFIVAAIGTFLLARQLGASILGSLMAGTAYALGGFFVVHVKHMPMVDAASWIPVVLWLVERGVAGERRALLVVGVVMGTQWLAGAPQIAYYSAGIALLYFAGRTWQLRPARSWPQLALILGLALVLAIGLASIQLLPTFELVARSERAGGVDYEFAASFPYALKNLKTFLFPPINGDPGTGDYHVPSIFWEDYAYIGVLPLLLGLLGGAWLTWCSGLARLLGALAAATFVLALGANTVLYRWAYEIVPGMDFFRFPQRFLAFTTLFVLLLAALAFTRLERWWQSHASGHTRLLVGLPLLVVVADLYYYHGQWNAIVDAGTWLEPPAMAQTIREKAGTDPYRVFSYDVFDTFRAAYRQAGGWRGDLSPYIAQRNFLQPSLNLIYDVPTADGYVNLVPDCLVSLWGNEKQKGIMDQAFAKVEGGLAPLQGFLKLFSLYNVRFIITSQPIQNDTLEFVTALPALSENEGQAYLYENPETLPRAFVASRYASSGDIWATLELMRSPSFDPRETVVLGHEPRGAASPPQDSPAPGKMVEITDYQPNQVSIAARLTGPGWLVLSDTYYPGWEATVDGAPVPVYQANGCVRAVPLDPGDHKVIFRFRPRSFYYGTAISLVSITLLVAGLMLLKPRPTPKR